MVVLVKALPHAGNKHGETVCCAGITLNGEWRRQFPVHFRRLDEKFNRWQIIEYDFLLPKDDKRPESRRIQEDTIRIVGSVAPQERASLLSKIIVPSTKNASDNGRTLALIRPQNVRFQAKEKSKPELDAERAAYQQAAKQGSFFDRELAELEPCKYSFRFIYSDEEDGNHSSTCDDWETAAMYRRFSKTYGEDRTLSLMKKTFEVEYPSKGMAFAMGTHSRYPDTWLLVGILRVDRTAQTSLDF